MFKFLSIFIIFNIYALDLKDLELFIEEKRVEMQVPGVAVAVVKENKVIFLKGFGVRRFDQLDKVNPATIFQLASVSKTFVSAGLGVAVDQGRVTWDEEIIKKMPQFVLKDPYPTRVANARDLLAHRTGLPAFRGDLLGKLGYSSEEILARVRYIEPVTSLRNQANYSNVGFFIAGELLGAIFKNPWEEVVANFLFKPLEMQGSGFAHNLDQPNVAFAHVMSDKQMKVVPWDRTGGFPAAGGISSTAADMANWMIMYLNGGMFKGKQILQASTVKEIIFPSMVGEVSFTEAPPIDVFSSFSYGLGWNNYNYKGTMIVEKGGGLDGIRTIVTLIPQLKMGICVLSNLNFTLLPEAIRAKFLEQVIGKSEASLQRGILAMELPIANLLKVEPPPSGALPPGHPLGQYTGSFENELYGIFIIKLENGRLIVEAGPGRFKGTLQPWSNETFILQWQVVNSGNEKVTFTFGPDNQAIQFQTETLGVFSRRE